MRFIRRRGGGGVFRVAPRGFGRFRGIAVSGGWRGVLFLLLLIRALVLGVHRVHLGVVRARLRGKLLGAERGDARARGDSAPNRRGFRDERLLVLVARHDERIERLFLLGGGGGFRFGVRRRRRRRAGGRLHRLLFGAQLLHVLARGPTATHRLQLGRGRLQRLGSLHALRLERLEVGVLLRGVFRALLRRELRVNIRKLCRRRRLLRGELRARDAPALDRLHLGRRDVLVNGARELDRRVRAGDARHGGEVLGFQLGDSSARETSALDSLELRRRGLLVLSAPELILQRALGVARGRRLGLRLGDRGRGLDRRARRGVPVILEFPDIRASRSAALDRLELRGGGDLLVRALEGYLEHDENRGGKVRGAEKAVRETSGRRGRRVI